MNSSRRGDDTPVLITEAQPSYDDQQAARRRKYAIMMSLRIPCLILAAALYHIWWLALIILALSIPLPWMAVLIANDRPARKDEHVHRYRRPSHELDAREHQVIDDAYPPEGTPEPSVRHHGIHEHADVARDRYQDRDH